MSRKTRQLAVAVTGLALLVFFQNCAEQNFSASSEPSSNGGLVTDANDVNGNTDTNSPGVVTNTGGPNCRDELLAATFPVRTLFVIDTSGSNVTAPGSDPNRAVRKGSIERYYNTYSARANFAWAFNIFSGTTSNALIGLSSSQPRFGNSTAMGSAITLFNSVSDGGNTPYQAAIDLAKTAITSDTARPTNSKYIVVFMSDGLPNPSLNDTQLQNLVTDLVATLGGSAISFNTVYYGPQNTTASERLRLMAQAGGGNFLDTNANPSGNAFLITDLVRIPGVNCQ